MASHPHCERVGCLVYSLVVDDARRRQAFQKWRHTVWLMWLTV